MTESNAERMRVSAIRGAVQAENEAGSVLAATEQLMREIIRVNDLDPVTIFQRMTGAGGPGDDIAVDFHRQAAPVQAQVGDQPIQIRIVFHGPGFTIELNLHRVARHRQRVSRVE